ncbi:O-methyltransferase-like protein, partial [Dinothrombium tinctorium]
MSNTIQEQQKLAAELIDRFVIDLWRSQVIYAAAKLDIADYLAIRPMTIDELAKHAGADATSIYRLLRALIPFNYMEREGTDRFRLTEKGNLLRENVPHSVKHSALVLAGDELPIFTKLPQAIQTGKAVSESLFG